MINISVKGFKLSDGTVEKYDYSSLEDIVTDSTLALSGVAADAKAVGDELADVKQDLSDLQEEIEGGGGGSGWDEYQQGLLITILRAGLYSSDQSSNIDALEDSFEVQYTNITLNTNSISLATIGGTSQLTATTTPAGGSVSWASSNTSVATVSATGLVTATGYGSATITASIGGLTATCSVTIAQATLISISAVYTQGGTVYNTTPLDDLKEDLVVTATWSNSTTSTVPSADYTLSGTLTEGTSTITVSYGGKTTTFNVTVTVVQIVTLSASIADYGNGDFTFEASASSRLTVYSDDGTTDITSSIVGGTNIFYQTASVTNAVTMDVSVTKENTSYRQLYVGSYDSSTNKVYNATAFYPSATTGKGTFTGTANVRSGEKLIFLNFYNDPYTSATAYSLIKATYEE